MLPSYLALFSCALLGHNVIEDTGEVATLAAVLARGSKTWQEEDVSVMNSHVEANDVVGCMACDVLAGRLAAPGGVIYEDAHWMLDHSVSPVLLNGFLILKPKRHVEHIGELTSEEAAAFGPLLRAACAALQAVTGAEKVYATSFGEAVRHIHFYLLPRLAGMPASATDVLQRLFRGDWACDDAAAITTAERVREVLLVMRE